MPTKKTTDQELLKLVRKNLKQTEALTKRFNHFQIAFKRFQFVEFIRSILIIVPVILALLYLVPLFRQFLQIYQPLIEFLRDLKQLNV